MTVEEFLRKLGCLEWTQEVRSKHPWNGDILVRRQDVEKILKEARK